VSEGFARALLHHRRLVVAALIVAALAGAWSARELRVGFDPEQLVAVESEVATDQARLDRVFGVSPPAVVVVLDARGGPGPLTSDQGLVAMHRLALQLREIDGVARVEGLTTSRLPRAALEEGTLDSLEDADERVEPLVRAIVDAEPDRFPAGLLSLGAPLALRPIGGDGPLSVEEAGEVRALIRSVPLVRGRLISDDERVAVIVALLSTSDAGTAEQIVREVRARAAASALDGVAVAVTGLPAMREEMNRALREDQLQLVGLAVLGTLIVLVVGMRSRAGVALPLGAVGIALALTMGLMAATGTTLNLLTNMLPPLLLTIGLAEAMHMVLRHGEEVRAGRDTVEAAIEAVKTMWLPCFVTTFTTAVGFAALMVAESSALRVFGGLAAAASMLGYVVTVTFVPAALPFFGAPVRAAPGEADALDRALLTLAERVGARPYLTIGVGAVVALVAVTVAQHVEVESRLLDQFARGTTIARTSETLESELDGFRTVELGLFAAPGTFGSARGLGLLDAVTRDANRRDDVLRASSVAELAHEALVLLANDPSARGEDVRGDEEAAALLALLRVEDAEGMQRWVADDGSAARVEIRVRDSGAARTLVLVDALRSVAMREAERRGIDLDVGVGGEAYAASRGLERITRALGGLVAAVVTIFVVMVLLFRSLRLGLLAIPPNAVPLLVTLAYMVLRGIALHAATVIVFTVTVGLAVDGTTHVVSRFREELENGGSRNDVLRRTVLGSGRAVLLSSVTLMVGYVVLLTSRFEPVRLFGELSLVSIAGATISQTLLLPAMLAVWGSPRRPAGAEVTATP
jgi:predicted RND superfamily exporter protein